MLLDDAAGDRETKPESLHLTGVRGVHLGETPEDGLELVGRDAGALVVDAEQHLAVLLLGGDTDGAEFGRELDRVGEEVRDRLHDPVRVGVDIAHDSADLHEHVGLGREPAHLSDRAANDVKGRPGLSAQGELAGGDPLDVEDVVDQPDQPVRRLHRDGHHPIRLLGSL